LNLINQIEWTSLDVDIKAAAYEGLLEKYAAEENMKLRRKEGIQ
jgi:type I restriction enzyme M protein